MKKKDKQLDMEPEQEQEKQPGKLTRLFRHGKRLIALLVTGALILGGLFLVLNWEDYNLDAIKRRIALRAVRTSQSGEAEPFTHGGGNAVTFAYLEDGILMNSTTGVRYYTFSGQQYAEQVRTMEHPVLAAASAAGVAYDAGGQTLWLYREGEEAFSLQLEGDGDLLSARVNESGWLAVTAQESGYKGTVTVYDDSCQRVFRLNRSSTFVVDAMVSPDGKSVAVITVGQQEGRFESQLLVYRLDREQPEAQVSLGNQTVLEMDYEQGQIWILCEDRLVSVSTSDWTVSDYSFGGRYLKGCSLGGDSFALLLFGNYRSGSANQAVVIAPQGQKTGTLDIQGQLLSFDAAGNYFSLLSGGALHIYTRELEPYRSLEDAQGARYTALAKNASALLADRQQAWLYIPQ